MRKILVVLGLLLLSLVSKADHITGGQIYYTYSAGSNGEIIYNVTFKLYMRCYSNRQFNDPTIVSVFDRGTGARLSNINVNLSSTETIQITDPDPCITNPPLVCYVVGYYNFTISLPASAEGYTIASQVNYRIAGIANMETGYNNIGATYTAEIPGTLNNPTGPKNTSARFTGSDLVIVCASNRFSYSFGATDGDGDVLHYSFCGAYRSGSGGNMIVPPPAPPYSEIPYGNSYFGQSPLGPSVTINQNTGLITGIAPAAGIYVVTVCVDEVRDGKIIARQRKDLQINIAPCNKAAAVLEPDYMLCNDTKTIQLANLGFSPLIKTYFWQITRQSGATVYTGSEPAFSYTFPDTGSYNIKLVINRGEPCTDSTSSIARVYPGFVPNFKYAGICFTKPTTFTDATTTVYGRVSKWMWDFNSTEFSSLQNPQVTFSNTGPKNVTLIVENSKGCRDTISQQLDIVLAPPLNLPFKDTLLCLGDQLMLQASGNGNFSWTPAQGMTNASTATPTVAPTTSTLYTVTLNQNGCINSDSVRVRVTDHVDLQMMNDTTICTGDSLQLHVLSNALRYNWTPANLLVSDTAASPVAFPAMATAFRLDATIGSCSNSGNVTVRTVPYPLANAGADTIICYGTMAQLKGSTNAASFNWGPALFVNDARSISPMVSPKSSTQFVLTATDNRGCPKPISDTVFVKVLERIMAFAGHDTSIVVDQELQLNASGGTGYAWSPPMGLSATNIYNPIARFNEPTSNLRYKVVVFDEAGCYDSAFIAVNVFATPPTVFVPTAFTPNADGKNDLLRPLSAGILTIEYFSVFNRWGQLMYRGTTSGAGWNGILNGVPQPTGTYAWVVKAVDFTGRPYFQKGTAVLIR